MLESTGQTFIIVDALDECPYGEERTQLSVVLKEFSTWALPNLHILVTSRKEPDIYKVLALLVTFPPVCIQTKQVDADIRLHVKTQLANDADLKEWSPQIKGEIETTLVEGADGMYKLPCLFKSLTADTVIKGSDGSFANWTP
jgi:ankyrin repeat domain-containing protein 50